MYYRSKKSYFSVFPAHYLRRRPRVFHRILITLGIIGILLVIFFVFVGRAPRNFPVGSIITIPENSSKGEIATLLKEQQVIRSRTVFYITTRWIQRKKPLLAGEYQFEKKKGLFRVMYTLHQGIFGNVRKRVTLFEGFTVREIAEAMRNNIDTFDAEAFIKLAEKKEGYLFPDTYLFFRSVTPETVFETLSQRYEEKIAPLREKIILSKRSEEEIIIMASLLEKEAYGAADARIISGILWKRIAIGMPLQVDAPFLYTLGKTSAQLTLNDLAEDGPYNTYTRRGLPPGPIANPGITMIEAALNPIESPYLFYLHDRYGNAYYARTHTEHVANKQKYLR